MAAVLTPTVPAVGVALSALLGVAVTDHDATQSRHHSHLGLGHPGDVADVAEAATSQYVGNVEVDRAARRVAELRSALDRLEAGVYGACEQCSGQIDPARLEVLPIARTCVSC